MTPERLDLEEMFLEPTNNQSNPMTELIRAELLKLRTLRMFWWTIAATIAFVPVSIAQAIFAKPPSAGLGSSEGIRNVFSAGASGGVVVLLIGIAVMAGEFPPQHGHLDVPFITPDRKRVILAKLAASSLVGVALGIIASLLTLAIALPWLANRDVTLAGHGTDIAVVLLGGIAATAISALAGVGVGALVTNQTLAIAVALIWSFAVDGIFVSFLPGVGRWTPGGAAGALSGRALVEADIVDDGVQFARGNDAADLALDLGDDLGGVLDAGAGRRAGMQGDLAGIHGGEEILAQERHQQHGHRHRAQEAEHENRRRVIASASRLR